MKFKCEVEVEWIDEEDNIDDAVKRQIVRDITGNISDSVKKDVKSLVDEKLQQKIDTTINDLLSGFINKPITVTDNYGDVKESYSDVTDMLKAKFDDFMLERVDEKGKSVRGNKCSYDNKPRLEYMLSELATQSQRNIKDQTDRFSKNLLNDVDRKIKSTLDASLKEKVSETLVKKINLDSVLS